MTDEQIEKELSQVEQDNITLDFTKWSFQRRQANLPTEHSLWETARDAVLARQRWDNAVVRQRYLDGVAAQRAAKQSEHEREIDAELEPTKQRLKRDWLANNPAFTESDFEKKAWIHLRQNLVDERNTASLNAEIAAQMAKGIYSL
jgi:hypothetical protein